MLKRLLRASICFVIALSAYWAYAIVLVPLIEPSVSHGGVTVTPTPITDHDLEEFFPEGAWERNKPKVLESDQFYLLFRDYQPEEKNSMKVQPVTLIYFPEGDRERRLPIIIQAPEGAIVESDEPINLAQAVFKPVRARLPGPVQIRRARSAPDHDDELYVATQSIQIDRR